MSAALASRPIDPDRAVHDVANRAFHLFWFGEGVSLLGNATSSVLLPLLAVSELHAGPGWMGVITASAWLPWLAIGLLAGAWVDDRDPRKVMIAADLCAAAVLVSVPVAWTLGVLALWQLAAVAFGGGIATVFFRTAYARLIPDIVDVGDLESANARLFGTESAMQTVGPGCAAVLTAAVGFAAGLLLDVISFLVSACCLWRLPAPAAGPAAAAAREPLAARIGAGLRLVARDPALRTFTIIGGLSNFGLTGYAALLVLYLVHVLGLGATGVAVVLAVGSVGGLVGASLAPAVARRLGTGRASTVLLVVGGVSALLVGLPNSSSGVAVTTGGLALVGSCVVGGNVVRGAWRQRYVPQELMGRVIASSQLVNFGTMPLAGIAAGLLGEHMSVRVAVIAMAGVHTVACCSVALTRVGRTVSLPEARS